MRKILLILSIPLLLTACVIPESYDQTGCTDEPGPARPVNIMYGDSKITVKPPLKTINMKKNLKFRLSADPAKGPGNLDYATVKVTIKSKDSNNHWINTSGTADGTNPLVVCVPDFQADRIVTYLVEVEDVGVLDPRVDVRK